MEYTMSRHQLELFMRKAKGNTSMQRELDKCGSNNSCVVSVARKHGHKFSPATLTRWQHDHSEEAPQAH